MGVNMLDKGVNMSEITIIDRVLTMCHAIHSARSRYKFMSTC